MTAPFLAREPEQHNHPLLFLFGGESFGYVPNIATGNRHSSTNDWVKSSTTLNGFFQKRSGPLS